MNKNSSNSSEEEVILDSPPAPIIKKQVSPAIAWCFTLNHYSEEQIQKIRSSIDLECRVGFFNKEIGESGTPHLQGYIEFKSKNRPAQKFGIPEIHWEKAKGNKDQNFKYCSKDSGGNLAEMTYAMGYKPKCKLRVITELRPWQKQVEQLINEELASFDDRTVNWLVDIQGCCGKTQFCKYLTTKRKQTMIITGGSYSDIACIVKMKVKDHDFDLNDETICVFNIPRKADDGGMISYKALESVKDGLMTSTKYESETMVYNCPSVWVFSNNYPKYQSLTKDRWKIYHINNNELEEFDYEAYDNDITYITK